MENLNKYEPRINSFNDKRLVYYVCPHERQLMITVVYEQLLKDKRTMYIVVELQGDLLKNRTVYKENIPFTTAEQELFATDFETTKHDWAHFAVKQYTPTTIEIADLSTYIQTKLKEDHLLAIYQKLAEYFKQNHKN